MKINDETAKPESVAKVRPALFSDAEAIHKVHERNGLGPLHAATWRAKWESYPFEAEFANIPIGWVLETDEGELVGTLANIHMLYEMDGRRLRAAIAADWAVDIAHRGRALHLTTTFFKQKGLDLLLNGSVSPTASKLLTGLQIPRIPLPEYSSPCFWAASSTAFARAVLERRRIPAASLLSYPAGLLLFARDVAISSGRGKISNPIGRIKTFDDRFDVLWQSVAAAPGRLRAVRTRAVLEWRFRSDAEAGRLAILTAGTSGTLAGYIILVRRAGSDLGMELYDVADLQAAGDDPTVIRDLLIGAVQLARERGVDAVKLMTGTPSKRGPAMSLRPYNYQLPFWQLYFRASPELKTVLAPTSAWDFSLFETY